MVAKKKVDAAAPKEEKKPKKEAKKQKKAPARKKASASKAASEDPDADIPVDLRGTHRRGRVSNKERTTKAWIEGEMRLLAADLLADIKKERKNMSTPLKVKTLGTIMKLLVFEDESNDESTLSLELMGQRYLGLKVEITNAEKASLEAFSAPKEDD